MIEGLVRLRRLGLPYAKIAKQFGVTRGEAIEQALRIGLRVRVGGTAPPPAAVDEPAAVGAPGQVLGRGVCHWIAGDVGAMWRMCGHKSVHGSVWCAHHAARVYLRLRCVAAAAEAA